MATRSSILAWKIPWTEDPGWLQSVGVAGSDTTEWLTHTDNSTEIWSPDARQPQDRQLNGVSSHRGLWYSREDEQVRATDGVAWTNLRNIRLPPKESAPAGACSVTVCAKWRPGKGLRAVGQQAMVALGVGGDLKGAQGLPRALRVSVSWSGCSLDCVFWAWKFTALYT